MLEIRTQTGAVRATAPTYAEALRVADAYTRADRALHTVHAPQEGDRR